MQTKKQNLWSVLKPILLICIVLTGIIITLHASTTKKIKAEKSCSGNCKNINADVLNAITVKLM